MYAKISHLHINPTFTKHHLKSFSSILKLDLIVYPKIFIDSFIKGLLTLEMLKYVFSPKAFVNFCMDEEAK